MQGCDVYIFFQQIITDQMELCVKADFRRRLNAIFRIRLTISMFVINDLMQRFNKEPHGPLTNENNFYP